MHRTQAAVLCLAFIALSRLTSESAPQLPQIVIAQDTIRINGVEIRTVANRGTRYVSLPVVERLLGKPQDVYPAGLGVGVRSWRDLGIHVQKGWRSVEKGKMFKFQVWLVNYYDKFENKHSGRFPGHLTVEGIDIGPDSTLDSLRPELEKKGFSVTEYPGVIKAEKGEISIFTVDTTPSIQRVEAWCTSNG